MPDKRLIMHNPDVHPHYMYNQTQKCPVGWCNSYKHQGKLSVKQMKKHECLKKRCKYFHKNPKHHYWEYQESKKQAKKEAKRAERLTELLREEIKKALDKLLSKK